MNLDKRVCLVFCLCLAFTQQIMAQFGGLGLYPNMYGGNFGRPSYGFFPQYPTFGSYPCFTSVFCGSGFGFGFGGFNTAFSSSSSSSGFSGFYGLNGGFFG